MGSQVLVANLEPVRTAQLADVYQRLECFCLPAPAGGGVCQPGECIANGIHIGGNGKAKIFKIVARIDYDGQITWGQDLGESIDELCAANTACKSNYLHFFISKTSRF